MQPPKPNNVIELNVGGLVFATSRQTLCADGNSMLARMFAEDSAIGVARDIGGRVFIDRDGTQFRFILNYLRDSDLKLLPDSPLARSELLIEARFYHLADLEKLLKEYGVVRDALCSSCQASENRSIPSVHEARRRASNIHIVRPEYARYRETMITQLETAIEKGQFFVALQDSSSPPEFQSVLAIELQSLGFYLSGQHPYLWVKWEPKLPLPNLGVDPVYVVNYQ